SLTLVLVHFQAVHELHVALRWGERRAVGKLIEGDVIEAAPAARKLDPHFQVAVANHARAAYAEQAVEARLGEGLPPWTASAQRFRGRQRNFLHAELAVSLDGIPRTRARQPARHLRIEGSCELIEPRTLESQPRGHGMTAEAVDETGMERRDRVE